MVLSTPGGQLPLFREPCDRSNHPSKPDLLTDPLEKDFTARSLQTTLAEDTTLLYLAVRKNSIRNQKKNQSR